MCRLRRWKWRCAGIGDIVECSVGTLRCREEMGKVSRPDCTPARTWRACQWMPVPAATGQPARRGEGQGRGWLSDLQIYNFRGASCVGGVDHAPSGTQRDADAVGFSPDTLRMWTRSSKQAPSTCLRRCRLAGDKGHELRGSLLFLFPHPRRAISLLSSSTAVFGAHTQLSRDIWELWPRGTCRLMHVQGRAKVERHIVCLARPVGIGPWHEFTGHFSSVI